MCRRRGAAQAAPGGSPTLPANLSLSPQAACSLLPVLVQQADTQVSLLCQQPGALLTLLVPPLTLAFTSHLPSFSRCFAHFSGQPCASVAL